MMDEKRKAFEAWAGKRERASTTSAWDYALKAWQAATKQERERCAVICDQLDVMSLDPMVCAGSAKECAAAIRQG